jgi:hypothetical protein
MAPLAVTATEHRVRNDGQLGALERVGLHDEARCIFVRLAIVHRCNNHGGTVHRQAPRGGVHGLDYARSEVVLGCVAGQLVGACGYHRA